MHKGIYIDTTLSSILKYIFIKIKDVNLNSVSYKTHFVAIIFRSVNVLKLNLALDNLK